MSKLDAQRAMKAARYDAAKAASSTRATTKTSTKTTEPGSKPATGGKPATRATRSRAKTTKAAAPEPATDAAVTAELCGHRSIQGKTCKRPLGHSETSHKYA